MKFETSAGIITDEILVEITEVICDAFQCQKNQVKDFAILQEGLTNIALSFRYNGGRYVYRHPGRGADELVDRGRESIIQKTVEDASVDTTLVAMSVKHGWRISKFIENRGFDYESPTDRIRGLRLLRILHKAPAKVRWEFDVLEKAHDLKSKTPAEFEYPEYGIIRPKIEKIYECSKKNGIKKCLTHGDARDVNFLINDREIHLIDWEYAGYGDPGFDIGTYVAGWEHSEQDVDNIIKCYLGRKPTELEYRHFISYVAISSYFFMHWTMWKEFSGQVVGIAKQRWCDYVLKYADIALSLYARGDW
jgi:thiamine kinase-like enzyme